jgi:hypothetical protein
MILKQTFAAIAAPICGECSKKGITDAKDCKYSDFAGTLRHPRRYHRQHSECCSA